MNAGSLLVWVVPVAALVLALGWFLLVAAHRLDRLHRRIEAADRALSDQLARRAQATTEVAMSGLLDPASSFLLHEAAARAVEAGACRADPTSWDRYRSGLIGFEVAREDAESDLSRALRATLDPLPEDHPLRAGADLQDLAGTCFRVRLARRLYNDAVSSALHVRRGRLVRSFRLAGNAPLPRTFEIDDEPSAVLSSAHVPGGL